MFAGYYLYREPSNVPVAIIVHSIVFLFPYCNLWNSNRNFLSIGHFFRLSGRSLHQKFHSQNFLNFLRHSFFLRVNRAAIARPISLRTGAFKPENSVCG